MLAELLECTREILLEEEWVADFAQMIQSRLHLDNQLQYIHRFASFLEELHSKLSNFQSGVVELS